MTWEELERKHEDEKDRFFASRVRSREELKEKQRELKDVFDREKNSKLIDRNERIDEIVDNWDEDLKESVYKLNDLETKHKREKIDYLVVSKAFAHFQELKDNQMEKD